MKKSIIYSLLLLILFLACPYISLSKDKSKDIIALEKKADKMYRQELYSQAKDIYSTLLSNYPKDPFYSFRFGVCLLYGDRRNIEKPIQYLELAAKAPDIDKEVFYYLGQAYHFNYRFTDAIRLYQQYRDMVSSNKAAKKDVDRQIEMCQNGLQLLSKVKDLYVLGRKEVNKADFYKTYDLTGFGGEILQEPPVFKSKLDKKKGTTGLVFFPKKQDVVLFSSYGADDKNGKDIYYSTILPDLTWSKPLRLPGIVNTEYDEDYPFLEADGRTLYFASKGHNSMGGYDIFKSKLDTLTGEWQQPENLDFAINTPFDDLLFVTDPNQHYAYFSSNRNSVDENIIIFLVRVDKRPDKIQEISLDQPYAGNDKSQVDVKRSVEIIKQMANLAVNSTQDNFKDSLATLAATESARPKSSQFKKTVTEAKPMTDELEYASRMKDKVKEKEVMQWKVDSAFVFVSKMEESSQKMGRLIENIREISVLTNDKKQKELADLLTTELTKESGRKQKKLEQARLLSANIQVMAATGNADSATALFNTLKNKISLSDTTADYTSLIKKTIITKSTALTGKPKDDFLIAFKPIKSKEEKDKISTILDMAEPDVIAFEPTPIKPGEDTTTSIIIGNETGNLQPKPETDDTTVISSRRDLEMNAEESIRVLNVLISQKDTLKQLKTRTQRQKLVLLSEALEKSNAAGMKFSEAKKMEEILETVITEGSARDMRQAVKKIKAEGALLAEEAVLEYTLAAKLALREKTLDEAIREVGDQAVVIEKTLDSGKIEKAKILLDAVTEPIADFSRHIYNNDDIIAATHRYARETKINVLTNYKQARKLAVKSKTASDIAINLKKQSDMQPGKADSKKLSEEAYQMNQQAATQQKEAIEIFNQNVIWQNRSKALENALPKSRKILAGIENIINQEHFKIPGKKIKDTTLLVPVILDILANNLPVNDTVYQKLAVYNVRNKQPQPTANEEILRRTEFAANVDDNLLLAQQQKKLEGFEKLEFKKYKPQELESLEKIALLKTRTENIQITPPVMENTIAISQWEIDKPSFILLKNQVDTLYSKVKNQPQLRLPSTLSGLFEELNMLIDSLNRSFDQYSKAKLSSAGKKDTSGIAMSLQLDAFEVRATSNRLKYLINRLQIGELASSSSNPELAVRPQPDSLIAVQYFYTADQKREEASQTKDKKLQLKLLRQADELEKNGIHEQEKLAEDIHVNRQQALQTIAAADKPAETKGNAEAEKKPEVKVQPKTGENIIIKPETKQEPKTQAKPEAKQEIKAQEKPVVKPEPKQLAKIQTKPDVNTEPKQEPKPIPGKFSVSKFVDRSPLTLTPVEITAVENEVRKASLESSLPMLPGIMYTVQVGVFKNTRSSAQLFNINPLFEDVMNNGNFRYFSGIFGDRNDAVKYKNEVVQKGVADAFVVIFYKGKRITTAEAAALTGESITKIIPQAKLDQLSKQKPGVTGSVGVYLSVQLAAYRRPLTEQEINYYKQKVNANINTLITETGLTVLVTGEFKDYNACLEARRQIIVQGVNDAFIVGFIDGKRVKAFEARQALIPVP